MDPRESGMPKIERSLRERREPKFVIPALAVLATLATVIEQSIEAYYAPPAGDATVQEPPTDTNSPEEKEIIGAAATLIRELQKQQHEQGKEQNARDFSNIRLSIDDLLTFPEGSTNTSDVVNINALRGNADINAQYRDLVASAEITTESDYIRVTIPSENIDIEFVLTEQTDPHWLIIQEIVTRDDATPYTPHYGMLMSEIRSESDGFNSDMVNDLIRRGVQTEIVNCAAGIMPTIK